MNEIKLVVFDMDGLMVDTESLWMNAFDRMGKRLGFDFGKSNFIKIVGISNEDTYPVIDEIVQGKVHPQYILDEARKDMKLLQLESVIEPKTGIYEILDILDDLGIKKAVATTTQRERARLVLSQINVYNRFDLILCGDEVKKRKPNPEIYNTVCSKLGINQENTLILEDSPYGVEAAHLAGATCIMIPDLVEPTQKEVEITYKIVNSLHDVIDVIRENCVLAN